MKKCKRGLMEDASFWIFRIILILAVVLTVVFFVNSIVKENIDTGQLELELISARIINSPYCLAKQDEDTGRVYPGVIEITNYDEAHLKGKCLITDEKNAFIGIKIVLEGQEPIYINKEYYKDIEPLTFAKKYMKVKKSLPVIVETGNGKETKALEVVVVAKKR